MSTVMAEIPGARVLDLFAGSGALGLEALSRGAARATFVEQSPVAVRTLRANIEALGAEAETRVVRADALRYVSSLDREAFDLAFADPPYGTGAAQSLAERFVAVPFAKLLCIEHGARETLPPLAGARSRRYGDTFLTFLPAAD